MVRGFTQIDRKRYEYLDHHVTGMTCGGCASKVRNEVGAVAGVTAVDADPATGRVTVESAGEVDPDAVGHAVEAAGYHVVA